MVALSEPIALHWRRRRRNRNDASWVRFACGVVVCVLVALLIVQLATMVLG